MVVRISDKTQNYSKVTKLLVKPKEIRSTLFELINDIEVYLKTQLANYFSLTYGPVGYLDPSNFNFKNHQEYIDIIDFLKRCGELTYSHH